MGPCPNGKRLENFPIAVMIFLTITAEVKSLFAFFR